MSDLSISDVLEQRRQQQYQAFMHQPMPTAEMRIADLKILKQLITQHQQQICQAIAADFGCRSASETALLEIFTSLESLNDAIKQVKRWMKPQRRHTSLWFQPAKNRLIPQPLGVVGIIVPWNYPLFLTIAPMVAALAAGNRVMVKMSENSQHLCLLLQQLFADAFSDEKICIIAEEGQTGIAFSTLAFDHLIFTGSTTTGKAVMAAAATHLVPVTLELGGKSPVILADDYDVYKALTRILGGKVYNSGQTCVAPDYLLIPEGLESELIKQSQAIMALRFSDIQHPDYTSIIDDASFSRLCDTVEDAVEQGAKVINLIPHSEPDSKQRKFPLQLVCQPTDSMTVMQREIFGPILPVVTYKTLQQALDYINARERPLALYLFSNDKAVQQQVLNQTRSGGVALNDVMLHVAQEDLPFGGVGHSGMGHYHGRDGFERLSKMRPVMYQAALSSTKYLYAPYGQIGKRLINFIINRKLSRYE
ncbi:coniferyl aldehyde dehydrogenase [Photobacterium kishitanii]|uniref:coniferyl aldehyde dehydrogenase n=1 Tax=Photobacterium kishitanii TaxID=318456 RepID=UPI0007EFDB81|nr:coniferyl aldehyde dehydrogenase [Photobacterium kishitanii]OBU28864.1 coniferyl-aldehyde dehydrogenase [Photobacterium kishitanii]PSU90678.1 coniferyl aldehyde dehydrogenase [Photobacterium kishitanii]PSW71595.1 coniferyl aldehyde dehydrogenase [Photobacterium kishitanii]